ncbi:hypothetical protein ACQP2F_37530 [Actinoplanes sp. CA-030573]|uniref:hypothetical protein n=1 Tax=Actinoplanes sp. CA-030573 TaxID=3239898 RepID=UPI003D917DE4
MTTPRLLGAVAVALGGHALGMLTPFPGRPLLLGPLLLVALAAIGELWLRALVRDEPAAVTRIGLAVTTGLLSLPLAALALHLAGVPIRALSLTVALAVLAASLGGAALLRPRSPAAPDLGRTLAALAIPTVVALVIGGAATFAYARMPHPPQPGYTSVALEGWAAGIDHPVTIPARGLVVPVRVRSAGEPRAVVPLAVTVGARPAGPPRPVAIPANTTRVLDVRVPAPPDGCLHRIAISLGAASTVFYGKGPSAC